VWLAEHAPYAETFVAGKHFMLRECPEVFNEGLKDFLEMVK